MGERTPLRIVPTFLGAHLLPEPGYLDLLVEEMLPACAPLAEGCDAFCDLGALSVEEARKALEAGKAHGLVPRLHAEELAHTGGALLAAELGCASADHLVHANDDDARALAGAGVVAVLLPATSFCLRSSLRPGPNGSSSRGVTIALATDCNPGTSYTTSMPFVIAVACSELRLSAEEAVRAATAGRGRGPAAARSRAPRGRQPGRSRGAGRRELRRSRLPPRDGPGARRWWPAAKWSGRAVSPMRPRDPLWPTAADWLRQADARRRPAEPELAVLGVPLSVTSITQPAGAHETPEAIRRRLAFLSTYHSERDVDVGELAAVDFGDLDPQPSNKEIASAARDVVRERADGRPPRRRQRHHLSRPCWAWPARASRAGGSSPSTPTTTSAPTRAARATARRSGP